MKYSVLVTVMSHDLLKPFIIIIDHLNPTYTTLFEVYGREFFFEKRVKSQKFFFTKFVVAYNVFVLHQEYTETFSNKIFFQG